MNLSADKAVIATLISAAVIFATRAFPFILFSKKQPPSFIRFIEKYIPPIGLLHERCQLCQIAVWASSNTISGSYNHTAFMEK